MASSDFNFEEDKLVRVGNGKKHTQHKKVERKIRGLTGIADIKNKKESDIVDDGHSDDEDNINNWSDSHISTLRSWKSSLREALFIYNFVMEKLKKKLNKIKVVLLIFSTLTTLIGAIATYALTDSSNQNNIWVSLVITILTTIIGAIMSFLNGFIKIYNLDELVQSYTLYIERMDTLYSDIASQLVLPIQLRANPFEFIKKHHEDYLNLIKSSPDIESSDNALALKAFHEYLEDEEANIKFSSKYTNNDAIIEVN